MTKDALTRAEAQTRAATVSHVEYAVALDVDADMSHPTFGATTVVTFDAREGAETFLNFEADAATVTLNGVELPASCFDGKRIALPGLRAKGNVVKVVGRANYHSDGVGLHRIQDPADGEVYLYTHFEPFDAHLVFASFDQPDLKAPMTMSITAPRAWKVVANNKELRSDETGLGRTTHHFDTTQTISTYLDAFVGGAYERVTSTYVSPLTGKTTELGLMCRKSMLPYLETDEIFEITRQGLEYYETFFGLPYPFEKYDQIFVAEFNMGAMENPGCITFNESYLFRSRVTDVQRGSRASVILHEMAHMWFGDLVTMKWWDDLWLNESFATFMSVLAQESSTNFPTGWRSFASRVQGSLAADQMPTTHPIVADATDTEVASQNFDGITYGKGAATLRQLYAWVGEDAFREGVRSYMRAHQWGNATLADFLQELERSSGRDMNDWATRWLTTSGLNTLSPELTRDASGKLASLKIVQEAPAERPTLRPHRIAIGLYRINPNTGVLELGERVEVDVDGPLTDVSAAVAGKAADAVLVNDGALTFAKSRIDATSIEVFCAHAADIREPLVRGQIMGDMWEMVRDGQMPARQMFDLSLQWVGSEPDADGLRSALGYATASIGYSHPSARSSLRAQYAAVCEQQLDAAVAGSDAQLVWASNFFSHAEGGAQLARVERVLRGSETIPGLNLDVAQRWSIVTRLASKRPAIAERLISQEEQRDNTDFGKRQAACARACVPTKSAKARAWAALTTDPESMSVKTLSAIASGFQSWDQEDLTRGYTPGQYERLVPQWWATLSPERAKTLTSGLFPASFGDQTKVIALADRMLARTDLPSPAVRMFRETRDSLLRVQRAQAVDLLARGAVSPSVGLS